MRILLLSEATHHNLLGSCSNQPINILWRYCGRCFVCWFVLVFAANEQDNPNEFQIENKSRIKRRALLFLDQRRLTRFFKPSSSVSALTERVTACAIDVINQFFQKEYNTQRKQLQNSNPIGWPFKLENKSPLSHLKWSRNENENNQIRNESNRFEPLWASAGAHGRSPLGRSKRPEWNWWQH